MIMPMEGGGSAILREREGDGLITRFLKQHFLCKIQLVFERLNGRGSYERDEEPFLNDFTTRTEKDISENALKNFERMAS